MIKLTEGLLDLALAAIEHHGYGDFFPNPPELDVVRNHWDELRPLLAGFDLDTYPGYGRLTTFAPKSRLNLRNVALLHPFDVLCYTALVLAVRDDITAARLPVAEQRVFSYRGESAGPYMLYDDEPSYQTFREKVAERVAANSEDFVGITDIGDFYPRIYQHRVVNALQGCADPSKHDHIRALEKLLSHFANNVSYGIPIGPPASRPLAEAVPIDVDSTLMSYNIDFIRFTDDFVIFAKSPEEAEYGIRILGETLYANHGLTLQTAKTKVLKASEYLIGLTAHSEKEESRRKLLDIVGGYDQAMAYEDLDEEGKKEIDALNLSGMLEEALEEGQNVDYKEVSFILGRLSALQKPELIPIVLKNLERLYPVAHSVAAFFKEFASLDASTQLEAGNALLSPLFDTGHVKPSEYYAIWVLSIFHHQRDWNHAEALLRVFRETNSDTVRRYSALALATSGMRAQAIQLPNYLPSASPLSRTAILLASNRMGADERKYMRQTHRLTDPLEKLCAKE